MYIYIYKKKHAELSGHASHGLDSVYKMLTSYTKTIIIYNGDLHAMYTMLNAQTVYTYSVYIEHNIYIVYTYALYAL